jgi:hypothetical protein
MFFLLQNQADYKLRPASEAWIPISAKSISYAQKYCEHAVFPYHGTEKPLSCTGRRAAFL